MLSDKDILRVLTDLIRSELQRMRGPDPDENAHSDPGPDDLLSGAPWHMDSIERMEAAAAVNEFFHLHETGLEDNLLRKPSLGRWVETVRHSRLHFDDALTFRTSGSSGSPKKIAHRTALLTQEIRAISDILPERHRIISFAPAHHIYGFLFGILLPALTDTPALFGDIGGIGALRRNFQPGDLLISFPAHWRYLCRSLPSWPAGLNGVSSTGPIDPDLVRELRQNGLSSLTEIYGCTEYGSIGFRSHPEAPFTLFPFLRRDTERSRKQEETDRLIRRLPDPKESSSAEISFVPEDILEWESDREFHVRRRRDGAVNIGGELVLPDEVATEISQHPLVSECAVRLDASASQPRLKALIVPATDTEDIRAEITEWIRTRLPAPRRPVRIRYDSGITRNAMGKPADWDA